MPAPPLARRRLQPLALGLLGLLLAGYGGVYYEECQLIPSGSGSFALNLWLYAVFFYAPALATILLSLGYLTAQAGGWWYYACGLGLALLLGGVGCLQLLSLSVGMLAGNGSDNLPVGYSPTVQGLLLMLPLGVVFGGSLGSFWLRWRARR